MTTNAMWFRIERDHLAEEDGGSFGPSYAGRAYATHGAPPKDERTYPVALYCYDDDMILYFTIGCKDSESAEHAHDWARDFAGCTFSKISEPRSEPATPFIG